MAAVYIRREYRYGHVQLLHQLERTIKDPLILNLAELGRTLLLALAALELANAWYVKDRAAPYPVDPDGRGVPLETLADLIQHPGVDGELLYVLLRLKSVLGAWRGEAADSARYRLGLKDLAGVIADHPDWGPALRATHRRLAEDTLSSPPAGDGAESPSAAETGTQPDPWRLRYALAHGNLSGDKDLAGRIAGDQGLFGRIIGEGNGPGAAIADYDAAIALMDDLRRLLEPEGRWEAGLCNDLAPAYLNRGLARERADDLPSAVADWGEATRLLAGLIAGGWLSTAADLLCASTWLFRGYRALADWPGAAAALLDFFASFQRLQSAWESGGWQGEPPWMGEVRAFAAAVQGLDPEQRAALLDALGEHGQGVRQAFGWDPPQGP